MKIADEKVFSFVTKMLNEKAPRVKWESARVIGNIAQKFPTKHNKDLLPAIEAICEREQDNAIKKKYLDAIKKVKKQAK